MNNPKISIIVPVYNVERYLPQCLDSILWQTFQEWECWLIDDGSTDKSGTLCDEYSLKDARIKVIHEKNSGSSLARQQGLNVSKGEYIVAIDSDDWVSPTYLQSMYECAVASESDIVMCDYYTNGDNSEYITKSQSSDCSPKTVQDEVLNRRFHAGLWCKMFKRELFTKFDVRFPNYSYYEDMYIFVSVLQYAKRISYLPHASYHYRYNPNSYTNDSNIEKRFRMYKEFVLNIKDLNEKYNLDKDCDTSKAIDYCVNFSKRNLIIKYYKYPERLKLLLKYFPHSMKIEYIRNVGDLFFYLASRYGFLLPYEVRGFFYSIIQK